MRLFLKGILCIATPIGVVCCGPTPAPTLPPPPASTQPLTHAVLPRIELRAFGLDGSTQVTVTPEGLLTYKRSGLEVLPTRTLQLTDAQIDELADAANVSLQTHSRPEHVTDVRIFHSIGNDTFDDDGPNPRFEQLNACLWRFCEPLEPKDDQ